MHCWWMGADDPISWVQLNNLVLVFRVASGVFMLSFLENSTRCHHHRHHMIQAKLNWSLVSTFAHFSLDC